MTYKILFLDIDGTILKPDHTYTDSTKVAIQEAKSNGIEVFIATGRPIIEIRELAEELQVESLIGYNGAYAIYQNEAIIDEPIGAGQIQEFIDIAKENDHELVLYSKEKNYFTDMDRPIVKNFSETFLLRKNALFQDSVAERIIGGTALNLNESEAQLYEINPNIRMSQVNVDGATHAYDIIRRNVNKGEAVKKILDRLGIAREQAIAFGDGMNDVEMLQSVGEGFAMGNSHPDLFSYAKHRTTSVSESGIHNGLKKLGVL